MDGITDGVKLIVDEAMKELQENMMAGLDQLEEGESISDFIESHFDAAGDPFAELKTRHKQDKYIKENLDYLASCFFLIKLIYENFNFRSQYNEYWEGALHKTAKES